MVIVSQDYVRIIVMFDYNDGSDVRKLKNYEKHKPIGKMPVPVRDGYVFVGWYTKSDMGKGSRFLDGDVVDRNIVLYAHWKPERLKRRNVFFNNEKDTWFNDAKNQTSLALGSEEYKEYLDDLEENHPSKEDDEMHVKLESYNEDLREKLAEKATQPEDTTMQKKLRWQMAKMAEAKRVHAEAVRLAFSTESLDDDARLRGLENSNGLIYDDGVTPDNYDDVYMSMVK